MQWKIAKSEIHGNGTFSKNNVDINTDLGLAIPLLSKTETSETFFRNTFGLLINHSKKPNSQTVKKDDGWHFFSIKPINKNEEITVDYDEYSNTVSKESICSGKDISII